MQIDEQDLGYGSEDLVILLYGLASDELIQRYVELNQILLTSGYATQLDVFELMFTSIERDELDTMEVVIEVDNVLREACRLCLLECGLKYQEEISLDILTILTRAILLFDTTEDPQRIVDLIESSEEDHEALLEILEYITAVDANEWITVISDVGTGVIDRIKDLAINATSVDYQVLDVDYQLSDRFNKLKTLVADKPHQKQLVESLETLTTTPSLESLYMMHLNELVDASMEEAVGSIYSLSCIANSLPEASFEAAKKILDDFYPYPLDRQQAGQTLFNLKSGYDKVYIKEE